MADATIHVRNLAALERAFGRADREERKLLVQEVKLAAEPVQRLAEGRALSEIRNMTVPWSQMRIGHRRAVVYIVPRQKGRYSRANRRLRRPNLKTMLLDRAMLPALDARKDEVERRLERMLAIVGKRWEKA